MTELLENLKRFIAAGDENRYYILNRAEVRLVIEVLRRSVVALETISGLDDSEDGDAWLAVGIAKEALVAINNAAQALPGDAPAL